MTVLALAAAIPFIAARCRQLVSEICVTMNYKIFRHGMEWKCVLSLSMFTCVSDLLSFRILLHRSYFRPIKMVPSWVPWCLSFP